MARTADGHDIVVGGTYWSNNLRRATVTGVAFTEDEERFGVPTGRTVTWFNTTDGLFDGSRLARRHPSTGEEA